MKNLIFGAAAMFAIYALQSCTALRSPTGPAGSANIGYGSASNISAGRNGINAATNQQMVGTTTDTSEGKATADKDSLSRKVESVPGDERIRQFIVQATAAGRTTIGLSQFVLSSAQNTNVKAFASMVMDNQKKASADLELLARAKRVDADSTTTDSVRNEKVRELSTVTGEELETRYVQVMAALQDQSLILYEEGASSKDADVKDYAKKHLPAIKIQQKALAAFTGKH